MFWEIKYLTSVFYIHGVGVPLSWSRLTNEHATLQLTAYTNPAWKQPSFGIGHISEITVWVYQHNFQLPRFIFFLDYPLAY